MPILNPTGIIVDPTSLQTGFGNNIGQKGVAPLTNGWFAAVHYTAVGNTIDDIRVDIFDPSGALVHDDLVVATDPQAGKTFSSGPYIVPLVDGQIGVIWVERDTVGKFDTIYFRRVTDSVEGTLTSAPSRLTGATQAENQYILNLEVIAQENGSVLIQYERVVPAGTVTDVVVNHLSFTPGDSGVTVDTVSTTGARDFASGTAALFGGGRVESYLTARYDIPNPYPEFNGNDPLGLGVNFTHSIRIFDTAGNLIVNRPITTFQDSGINVEFYTSGGFGITAFGDGHFGTFVLRQRLEPLPLSQYQPGDESYGWKSVTESYEYVVFDRTGGISATIPLTRVQVFGDSYTYANTAFYPGSADDASLIRIESIYFYTTGLYEVRLTVFDDTFVPVATQVLASGPISPEVNKYFGVTATLLENGDLGLITRDADGSSSVEIFDLIAAALQPSTGVSEDAPDGTLVGQIKLISHPASDIASLTLSGPDADQFTLTADRRLFLANGATLDYEEAQFEQLVLILTDSSGDITEIPLQVPVNDVNEAPTDIKLSKSAFVLSSITLIDYLPLQVLATVSTTDPDITGDTFQYELLDGANGKFLIVGDKLVVGDAISLNLLDQSTTFNIQVRTTDNRGLDYTETLQVKFVIDDSPIANSDVFSYDSDTPLIPVTINVLVNDAVAQGEKDPRSVLIVDPPAEGTAEVLASGAIRYTPPSTGFKPTTFTYTFEDDADNKSNTATVKIAPKGEVPDPLVVSVELEPVEGQGYSEFIGTFTVGRSDGIADLIRVENGTIRAYADRIEIIDGTIFSVIGTVDSPVLEKPLFRGNVTLAAGTAKGAVVDSNSIADDVWLAGKYEFIPTLMQLDPNRIDLGGAIFVPDEFGGAQIEFPENNGFSITPAGISLFNAGVYRMPDTDFRLGSTVLSLQTKGVAITYKPAEDLIKLQGSLQISDQDRIDFYKLHDWIKPPKEGFGDALFKFDAGDISNTANTNGLQWKDGIFTGAASFVLPEYHLTGAAAGFSIKDFKIGFARTDTIDQWTGGIGFGIPVGGTFGGAEARRTTVAASLKINTAPDLEIEEVTFDFTGRIPVPQFPLLQLVKLSGKGSGLADGTPQQPNLAPMSVQGTIGLELGWSQLGRLPAVPEWIVPSALDYDKLQSNLETFNILGLEVTGKLFQDRASTGEISLGGSVSAYIFSPLLAKLTLGSVPGTPIPSGGTTADIPLIDLGSGAFNMAGAVTVGSIFEGSIKIKGDLMRAPSATGGTGSAHDPFVSMTGSGAFKFPDLAIFGPYRGTTYQGAQFYSYAALNADDSLNLTLSTFGAQTNLQLGANRQTTTGVQFYLDGMVDYLVGGRQLNQVGSWEVPEGLDWITMWASWTNPQSVLVPIVVTYRETEAGPILATFTEAEFAQHGIYIVEGVNDAYSRMVSVISPLAGVWDIEVVDPAGLEGLVYDAHSATPPPVLSWANVSRVTTPLPGIDIAVDLTNVEADALIDIYADTDRSGNDGELVAAGLTVAQAEAGFRWDLLEASAGDLYLYAVIRDGINGFTFTPYRETAVRGADEADLAVTMTRDPTAADDATTAAYTIHVVNRGPDSASLVDVTLELAGGQLAVVAKPGNVTGPSIDESFVTFAVPALASGTSFDIVVTVTGADGGAARNPLSVRVDATSHDPALQDNYAVVKSPASGPAPATLDIATIDASAAEGDSGATILRFNITRSGDVSGTATADYYVIGSAVDAFDFTADGRAGSVTFASGETVRTVEIQVQGDAVLEADETFAVKLAGAAGAVIGTDRAFATIINDDAPPPLPPATLSIAALAVAVAEGNSGSTSITFELTRSGDTASAITVDYGVTGSGAFTADAGDFAGGVLPSGTLSLESGETSKQFSIAIAGDLASERAEGFAVILANPVGATLGVATAFATILNDDVAAPVAGSVSVSDISISEGDAGTKLATFTLTRSGGTAAFSVDYTTANGTATAGADYAAANGTASFAAGVDTATVSVTINGDTAVEADETFLLDLSNATGGATIADGQATGTISNDDVAAPVAGSVSVSDISISEGDAGTKLATFTLTRSGGTAAFSVDYTTANGTATAGADYAAANGTASFAAGVDTATVSVTINGDTAVEADETFLLDLSNATGGATIADGQATGTISNDDVAAPVAGSVSVSDISISEGDAGTKLATFTLTRSGGTAAFSVDYTTANGTATAGADYAAANGTASFAAGVDTATVSVTINGDTAVEADETFLLDLSNATGGATIADGQATGTISNDDVAAPVAGSVSVSDISISEGDAGTKLATFTLTRSGGTAAFSVDYTTANGTATAGADYAAANGTASFAAGVDTATVSVTINGDTAVEADETFLLDLSNATGGATIADGQATGTISNDDVAAPVAGSVSVSDISISEGDAGTKLATFTLTRSGGTAAFSVDYTTANGTATAGADYAAASGTASFAAGVDTATVTVTINGDTAVEADETFLLDLSNATGGATIADGQATGTISNDDVAAPVAGSVSVSDISISEGDAGTKLATFTLTRSGGTAAFSVDYTTANGTATAGADYAAASGTASFAAGVDTATVTVTINGDTTIEPDETFLLNLSNATGGATIADAQATGTITNDDARMNVITGTPRADHLQGTDDDDLILPLGGTDVVDAGSGNDVIRASISDGSDFYLGGSGTDTIDYSALTQRVDVKLSELFGLGTGIAKGHQAGVDILASIENVVGGSDRDKIEGNSFANRLEGGAGNDILTGGAGSDTFVFAPGFGKDRITDFDARSRGGQDFIELSGFGITAADFGSRVSIADVGAHTLVTIDADPLQTIRLSDIGNRATVTVDDFWFS